MLALTTSRRPKLVISPTSDAVCVASPSCNVDAIADFRAAGIGVVAEQHDVAAAEHCRTVSLPAPTPSEMLPAMVSVMPLASIVPPAPELLILKLLVKVRSPPRPSGLKHRVVERHRSGADRSVVGDLQRGVGHDRSAGIGIGAGQAHDAAAAGGIGDLQHARAVAVADGAGHEQRVAVGIDDAAAGVELEVIEEGQAGAATWNAPLSSVTVALPIELALVA